MSFCSSVERVAFPLNMPTLLYSQDQLNRAQSGYIPGHFPVCSIKKRHGLWLVSVGTLIAIKKHPRAFHPTLFTHLVHHDIPGGFRLSLPHLESQMHLQSRFSWMSPSRLTHQCLTLRAGSLVTLLRELSVVIPSCRFESRRKATYHIYSFERAPNH